MLAYGTDCHKTFSGISFFSLHIAISYSIIIMYNYGCEINYIEKSCQKVFVILGNYKWGVAARFYLGLRRMPFWYYFSKCREPVGITGEEGCTLFRGSTVISLHTFCRHFDLLNMVAMGEVR